MNKQRQRWWRSFWCSFMHDDFCWPINGHYRCRKCSRVYAIPWK